MSDDLLERATKALREQGGAEPPTDRSAFMRARLVSQTKRSSKLRPQSVWQWAAVIGLGFFVSTAMAQVIAVQLPRMIEALRSEPAPEPAKPQPAKTRSGKQQPSAAAPGQPEPGVLEDPAAPSGITEQPEQAAAPAPARGGAPAPGRPEEVGAHGQPERGAAPAPARPERVAAPAQPERVAAPAPAQPERVAAPAPHEQVATPAREPARRGGAPSSRRRESSAPKRSLSANIPAKPSIAPAPAEPLSEPDPEPTAAPAEPKERVASASPPSPPPKAAAAEPAELALFRRAQALHNAHDTRAIAAWDAFLRVASASVLAPEARYNRALGLVRASRFDEARRALKPFAAGAYGAYRKEEAQALLARLPE